VLEQISVQFSSVAQSCLTLCYPMDCSTPGFLSITNSRAYSNSCSLSRWYHPTISSSVVVFSSSLQSFPASWSFQMSQFFTSGGQSIGGKLLFLFIIISKLLDYSIYTFDSCCKTTLQKDANYFEQCIEVPVLKPWLKLNTPYAFLMVLTLF